MSESGNWVSPFQILGSFQNTRLYSLNPAVVWSKSSIDSILAIII